MILKVPRRKLETDTSRKSGHDPGAAGDTFPWKGKLHSVCVCLRSSLVASFVASVAILVTGFMSGFAVGAAVRSSQPSSHTDKINLSVDSGPRTLKLGEKAEVHIHITWSPESDSALPVLSPFETENLSVSGGSVVAETDERKSAIDITYSVSGIEAGEAAIGPFTAYLVGKTGVKADSTTAPKITFDIAEVSTTRLTLASVISLAVLAGLGAYFYFRRRSSPEAVDTVEVDPFASLEKLCSPSSSREFLTQADDIARRVLSERLAMDVSNLTTREIVEEMSKKAVAREEMTRVESFFSSLTAARFSKDVATEEELGEILSRLRDLYNQSKKNRR